MRHHTRRITKQRVLGALLLLCAALALAITCTGRTPADRDGTAALLFAALGLWLILSKRTIIN